MINTIIITVAVIVVTLTVTVLPVKSSVEGARELGEMGTAWEKVRDTYDTQVNKLRFLPLRIHRPVDKYMK